MKWYTFYLNFEYNGAGVGFERYDFRAKAVGMIRLGDRSNIRHTRFLPRFLPVLGGS